MPITIRKLTEHIQQAIAHGKVSQKTANALLLGTGYTPQTAPPEVRQLLASALRANLDRFDAGAQQALDAFINPTGTTAHVSDGLEIEGGNPDGMVAYQSWTQYGEAYGKLFVKGPSGRDLHQGAAGDCYFDASVASLAYTHPEQLKQMFHENPDGTVTVTFHQANPDGSFTPVPVTVDRSVPEWTSAVGAQEANKPIFDTSGNPTELWPLLVEKAFAKWKGSYEAIGEGGWPAEALAAVTGKAVTTVDTTQVSADDLFQKLQQATGSKQPVVCYTYPRQGHEADFDATGTSDVNGTSMTNVVDSHAYSIFGARTDPATGQRYVILRNPWGMHEAGSDGRDDGVFRLPLEQFMKLYPSVSFTPPPQLPPPPPIAG